MQVDGPELLEGLLTLAQAARRIPGRPHVATIWRWSQTGVRGQRLETVLVGGRRYTSEAKIADFLAALNPGKAMNPAVVNGTRARQQQLAARRASELF